MPLYYQDVRVSDVPDYNATIPDLVRGNDLDVIRTVSPIPSGQTVTDGWLRVDAPDPPGGLLFQKHITTTLVAGEGQIEDSGSGDGVAVLRFEITNDNSALMTGGENHAYGIQIKTSGLKIYEFEIGVFPVVEQVVVSE